MTEELAKNEESFFGAKMRSKEARSFFRHWRRNAINNNKSWSEIRKSQFLVKGKTKKGVWLISALRSHLTKLQGGRCCYCRRPLQGIAWAKPIDHILPKDKYPRFTFHYRNLAVACYDCNHTKSNDEWSGWRQARRRYIPEKRCKEFFHPRYHHYDDHVQYLHLSTNGASLSVYYGLTRQGKRLCVDLLHKTAAREVAITANPRLEHALVNIRNHLGSAAGHAATGDLDEFLKELEALALPKFG